MAKWIFFIWNKDKPGEKQAKKGDVVGCVPYQEGYKGGLAARKIVTNIVVDNMSELAAMQLCGPEYDDGSFGRGFLVATMRALRYYAAGEKVVVNSWAYMCVVPGSVSVDTPVFSKKHNDIIIDGEATWRCLGSVNPTQMKEKRLRVNFSLLKKGWLPDLDTEKITDLSLDYQPFEKTDLKIAIVIDANEEVKIFKDLYKGTYKYKREKVKE